ncbi:MAG TPA: hypothetical protein VKY66_00960 [Protaetiibacter sp.]|nr:hypothetical protein [Protaetiibacter sp.]
MRRNSLAASATLFVILATAGCTQGGTVNPVRDYESAISATNALLDELQAHAPADAVERVEIVNTDLDTDHHRMDCSDTTSMFRNGANLWLTAGADPVPIIDRMRDALLEEGWTRETSLEELETGSQGTEGTYRQIMVSSDGFTAGLSKWKDGEQDGVQISLTSPCVDNPVGKPDTWGR